ncbi:MAG: hypothetical protein GC204_03830 [Chloroflexi bacterium]|nr:hypothetical protein [Chloroflexota bacterium]
MHVWSGSGGAHKDFDGWSPAEVLAYLTQLNDSDLTYAHVGSSEWGQEARLSIFAGHLTRRVVIANHLGYASGEPVNGRLIDPEISVESGVVQFRVVSPREADSFLLRQTVETARALEVARFVLEKGVVPEDSQWEMPGDIWPFLLKQSGSPSDDE